MSNFDIVISCASGIESILKHELYALGYPDCKAINGRIKIQGDEYKIATLNLNLRTAERVYMSLGSFKASTFDELFDGVNSIHWEDFLPFTAKILVNGKSRNSKLFSLRDCQKIIKKSILTNMKKKYSRNVFPENGEAYEIEFNILNDVCEILLNTSGVALHKRGYKDLVWQAPIKETLAAAIVSLSRLRETDRLIDPFCGSGTIVIEAALMALNIAPGKFRHFAFENWDSFPLNAKKMALENALDNEKHFKLDFSGSDVAPKAIELANHHAKNAGVSDCVSFGIADVRNLSLDGKGIIITNPPYGERMLDATSVKELYSVLGDKVKNSNFAAYIITSANKFETAFGKPADFNRKFYNSEIECKLYGYKAP